MGRLSEAFQSSHTFTRSSGTSVYGGEIDANWNIGNVPHGGYMAAVVLNALCRHMAPSPKGHCDPAHLTIQFLVASSPGAFQIEISTVSISGRWTRLDLSLFQFDKDNLPLLRLRSHALFTNLPELGEPAAPSATNITIMPNSITDFAQPYPFAVHPSESTLTGMPPIFNFKDQIRWSSGAGMDSSDSKKLEWHGFVELVDEREDLRRSAAFMGFFGDLFRNGFERLPKAEQPAMGWLPTLHFAVEFKSKFPLIDTALSKVAPRTVAVYAKTDYVHAGRYGATVEIWSAPGAIGAPRTDGGGDEWRSHGRILAVATQMALIVPAHVNDRHKPKL